MPDRPLRIFSGDVADDRFSRFRLLEWWDQERIRGTKVAVIGAALGNEISRTSRCSASSALSSRTATGLSYQTSRAASSTVPMWARRRSVAAKALRQIYDQATPVSIVANVLSGVGLGLFAWADIILAGLDNREARLAAESLLVADGASLGGRGNGGFERVVRVFLPGEPPCYECTLGDGLANPRTSDVLQSVDSRGNERRKGAHHTYHGSVTFKILFKKH